MKGEEMTGRVGRMDDMGDLAEFLLARIAEDEAERVTRFRGGPSPTPRELREAARWEAECKAKRRIVLELRSGDPGNRWANEAWRQAESDVLRLLALPYADHPDFHEEWRA